MCAVITKKNKLKAYKVDVGEMVSKLMLTMYYNVSYIQCLAPFEGIHDKVVQALRDLSKKARVINRMASTTESRRGSNTSTSSGVDTSTAVDDIGVQVCFSQGKHVVYYNSRLSVMKYL